MSDASERVLLGMARAYGAWKYRTRERLDDLREAMCEGWFDEKAKDETK